MRCPTIDKLPSPAAGRIGWPWEEDSHQAPDFMHDQIRWPKISIITPSFNQGLFIEETIRSVLLQGYRDIEYIIIDGGSTDGSIDIIKRYEPWLSYWVSEPDNGQSHAINKGIRMAHGDLIAWINADDLYYPNAFSTVAGYLFRDNMSKNTILFSDCDFIDKTGHLLYKIKGTPVTRKKLMQYWKGYFVPQPTVFFPAPVLKANLLNEDLDYVMDWDLWLRLNLQHEFVHIDVTLAKFRTHQDSKWGRSNKRFIAEHKAIVHRHHRDMIDRFLFHLAYWFWKTRMLYHHHLRIYFRDALHFILPERFFTTLQALKKKYLPFLSKIR